MKNLGPWLLVPLTFLACVMGCLGCASERTPNAPPEGLPIAQSPEELVQHLEIAYRAKDLQWFGSLLANEAASAAAYRFVDGTGLPLVDVLPWGYATEMRIHRRMFDPGNILEGETQVPDELRMQAIHILLRRSAAFVERTDLYATPQSPDGLVPTHWKAWDAIYSTDVLFDLKGDIDYQVTGRANFVVIEDQTKQTGEAGKYLLLQWIDMAGKPGASPQPTAVVEGVWSNVKKLYY